MKGEKCFYLVSAQILPEAIRKTAYVKEMLAKQEVSTINEAVEKVGLARSTYYKYKDGVFPQYIHEESKIKTISLVLHHKLGILAEVIRLISENQGNILTVNQNIPVQGVANVTISFESNNMNIDMVDFLQNLEELEGVSKVDFVTNM